MSQTQTTPLPRGCLAPPGISGSPSAAGEAARHDTVRRLLICLALYAVPAVVVMRPVTDYDLWWHLRTGQWIVEHGTVPATDPFSHYGLDKPWIAYSWLVEVLLYGLHQGLGLTGVLIYRALASLAVVVTIHRFLARREPRFLVATGLAGLTVVVLIPMLNERPWLLSILLTTVTLEVILDLRQGRPTRALWWLPPLFVLWANVHIQFIYGLFLLVLACAAPLLDEIWDRRHARPHGSPLRTRSWWQLVALTGACGLATLVNPYHVRLYGVVAEYALHSAPGYLILELVAPDFRQAWDWIALGLAGTAVFTLGRRARLSSFDVLFLVVGAYLCFHARRDLWLLTLAALTILVTPPGARATAPRDFTMTRRRLGLVAGGTLGVLLVAGWARQLSEERLQQKVALKFPVQAAQVVEERGYPGPLYNDFNWGGYLIWRLPNLPVAMDGRTNVHGDPRIIDSVGIWAGRVDWSTAPELAAAELVIANRLQPLTSLLRFDVRFQLVYEDEVSVVFVRRHAS